MSLLKEFKEFAMKGNVVDMAVGIIIGTAFGKIVSSLVGNVMMPVVGLFGGSEGLAGITLGPMQIGLFLQAIVDFLIVAVAIFAMIKVMNRMQEMAMGKEQEEMPPAAPPEDIALLREIRDSLARK